MTPLDRDRWRRLEAVLDQLLDLPPAEQQARLAHLAATDADLAAEARAFLEDSARAAASELLARPAGESAARLIEHATTGDAPEARVGQRLGAWELTGILGEGGMGVVYAARRADGQYEAEAAIKLMLAVDPDSPLRDRLLAERQILARLDDPRIAHLYDGGVSADGHPYLVMERVTGRPLTEHCEQEELDLGPRLDLFTAVCQAVDTAHRRMVLHCDLKPSNILVTTAGELKLLDFGVARPLESPALMPDDTARAGGPADGRRIGDRHTGGDHTGGAHTDARPAPAASPPATTAAAGTLGSRLLTPGYASPEQLAGQPLTAASDVFALGVLLHELLTGRRPPGRETREALAALASGRPAAPADSGTASRLAALAGKPWSRRLRGDLDRILQRALAPDPGQRYATARELAADLDRWRRHLPVAATPDRAWYRLRKRVERNRLASAAVVLLAVAVLTGTGATAWQARVAAQQRDQAQREALRAQTINNFLMDLFRVADPDVNAGADLTAREILARGREQIGALAGDPTDRAAFMDVLADVHFQLGMFAESRDLQRQRLRTYQAVQGSQSDDISDTRIELASSLIELGDLEAAAAQIESCLVYRRARPRDDPFWLNVPLAVHARLATESGDDVTAAARYRRVLSRFDAGDPDPRTQQALGRNWTNLAVALNGLGRLAAADSAYARAEAHLQRSLPAGHSTFGSLYSNWALTVHALGRLEEAERRHRQALAIKRELRHNRVEIGLSLINLANLLVERDRVDEALPMLEEAVQIQRESFGETHLYVAAAEINLGLAHLASDRPAAADTRFAAGEAIIRDLFGPDSGLLAIARTRRGQAAHAAGDLDTAAAILAEAVAMHRRHLPNLRRQFGEALLYRAEAAADHGDRAGCREAAAEAATVLAATMGADHPRTLRARELAAQAP